MLYKNWTLNNKNGGGGGWGGGEVGERMKTEIKETKKSTDEKEKRKTAHVSFSNRFSLQSDLST